MNQVQKKYLILGSLCALVLTLAVGYAAFQSILKINGTTNISSDWDVRITAIEKTAGVGATDKEAPSYDNTKGLSATFNTNLTSPGDYATYKITITNNGSLDAVLKTITIPENTNNDIIFYLNKDQNNTDIAGALKQNDTLTKTTESNNVGYVYVTVLYKDYANQQTATTKTASMTVTFDFEQKTSGSGGTIGPAGDDSPKTVYAYHTDSKIIGTTVLTEADYKMAYTELDSYKAGKTWFLKYDIDAEGVIQNAYSCMKYTFIDEPVCLQGGKDSEGNTYYSANKEILTNLQSTFIANSGSCSSNDSEARCSKPSLDLASRALSTGVIFSASGTRNNCAITIKTVIQFQSSCTA